MHTSDSIMFLHVSYCPPIITGGLYGFIFISRRQQINLAVLSMKESGTLMQLQNKWWMERSECPRNSGDAAESDDELSLSSLAGIFYILIAGLVLALWVACCEFCHVSRKDARKCQVGWFAWMPPAFSTSYLEAMAVNFIIFQISVFDAMKAKLRATSQVQTKGVPATPI